MTGPAVREGRVSQAQQLDREIWDLFDGVFWYLAFWGLGTSHCFLVGWVVRCLVVAW
jgi:hypothetical protein